MSLDAYKGASLADALNGYQTSVDPLHLRLASRIATAEALTGAALDMELIFVVLILIALPIVFQFQ